MTSVHLRFNLNYPLAYLSHRHNKIQKVNPRDTDTVKSVKSRKSAYAESAAQSTTTTQVSNETEPTHIQISVPISDSFIRASESAATVSFCSSGETLLRTRVIRGLHGDQLEVIIKRSVLSL